MPRAPRKESGIFLGDLRDAPRESRAAALCGTLLPRNEHRDAARHYDAKPQVTVVFLSKDTKLTEPKSMRCSSLHTHLLVIAERGTECTLSVYLDNTEPRGTHVTEVFCGDDASVRIHTLQAAGTDTWIAQRGRARSNAHITWCNASFGARDVRHDLASELCGDSAVSDVTWMFHAKDHDAQRLSAKNVFSAKNGGGEIVMRGIAEGRGHVTCNGMIQIELAGGGTDTYLTQDVLMLDPVSKVDAIPGLEIKTNDVKASHSATVSRVTAEDLFYFAARGIDEEKAREMYIEGYLLEIVSSFKDEGMKKEISKKL